MRKKKSNRLEDQANTLREFVKLAGKATGIERLALDLADELGKVKRAWAEDAYRNEVTDPEMLPIELEALPGVSAKQFKEDWIADFIEAIGEEMP